MRKSNPLPILLAFIIIVSSLGYKHNEHNASDLEQTCESKNIDLTIRGHANLSRMPR